VEAIGGSIELLEKGKMPQAARRTATSHVRAMLDRFQALNGRRPITPARAEPLQEEIRRLEARLAALISR
jgi:hypothetical protein